jgi:hypothetical protein
MTSRRADALAALLLALSAACLLAGLARLPALTVDESWVGLFAGSLRARGLFTPHEMNTYTGPLFGLLVSKAFAALGASVRSLRLPGACLNVAALLILAAHHRRRFDPETAAWLAALFAGSAYFLLKSRLAWEVYAFQPLLLALTIRLLDGAPSAPRTFALCAVTLIGVQNHFIYLAVPLSLCLVFAEDDAWLPVWTSILAAGAVVFLVKPRLSAASWGAERIWAVPLFCALPVAAALLHWRPPVPRRLLRGLTALGLAAFAVWHLIPLWQLLAGPLVWRRLFSWIAPWSARVPLMIWSGFLIALLGWRAARAWHRHEPMGSQERVLALWPAAYAAIFILFRNTTSLRYYSTLQFLTLAALAPALARLPPPDRRKAAVLAAFSIFMTQGVFWRELAAPGDRAPLSFKIGTHTESSRDFSRKDAVFAAYDASGACGLAAPERNFIAWPLSFHRLETGPLPCDRAKAFDADLCPDCASPPYYRWSVVTAPPRR